MSFKIDFKVDRTEEGNKEVTYAYINNSGIYDVKIIDAFISESKNGSNSIDFLVEYEGRTQVIYGQVRVSNNDGNSNPIGRKTLNELLVIANIGNIKEEDCGMENIQIGSQGSLVSSKVLYPLRNLNVKMKIQFEYSIYLDEIKEKKAIKTFYREDGATSGEIVKIEKGANKDIIGSKLELDRKYEHNIYCKGDLTEADVTVWIANGKQGGVQAVPETGISKPNFKSKEEYTKDIEDEAIPF